jgi:phosphoglycolate phosphatase
VARRLTIPNYQITRLPNYQIFMVRLVVFDLDGTLIDSRRDLAESANVVLAEHGCPPLAEVALGRMVGDGAAMLVSRAFEASGRVQPPGALKRFLEVYDARLVACTRPYAGVPEMLQRAKARAAIAILTNKPLGATRRILSELDLERFFRASMVVGADGPFARKPDPGGMLFLADAARVAARDALMVGDSIIDWKTARAAGSPACLARYGFGFDGFPAGCLRPGDTVIDEPGQLMDCL